MGAGMVLGATGGTYNVIVNLWVALSTAAQNAVEISAEDYAKLEEVWVPVNDGGEN